MYFLQDLHYGWRNLSKTPGFLLVAVLSLALGMGANTALFSLVYSAIYKSLPVSDPRLLVLFNDPSQQGVSMGTSDGERQMLTWDEFHDLHQVKAMEGLFAVQTAISKLHVRFDGGDEVAHSKLVSGAYFSVLGLTAQAGRFFDESVDSQIGSAPYIVLSDAYWSQRFGRERSVIGRTMVIQNTVFQVIGVGPRGFSGENVGQNPDFWAPVSMQLQVMPGADFLHPLPDPEMKVMWLHVFGRLRQDANLAQAQTQADAVFKQSLQQSYQSLSADTRKDLMNQRLKLRPAANGASGLRGRLAESLYVIFAAVGAVLLICCANLSNLLLARANSRQREITVRMALGASRFRVMRQLFTEGLLISFMGAALGLLLSQAMTPLLLRTASQSESPIHIDASLDWRILLFTGAVAIGTTLICCLIPTLRAAGPGIMSNLREGGRGMTASRSKLAAGRLFVAAQVALSLLLLLGAGLFLRTLINLQNVDLGYKKENLAILTVDGSAAGYNSQARAVLYRKILDRLRAAPGVNHVTFSANGLFSGSEMANSVQVEGYTPTGKDDRSARFDAVGPRYFTELGIRILQGRDIEDRDASTSPTVCVVNDAFAKQFSSGGNVIGKHITVANEARKIVYEIVGVARDTRDHSLRDKTDPRVYTVFLQGGVGGDMGRWAVYEARMANDGGSALTQLRNAVLDVDRNLEVDTRFLARSIDNELSQERLVANLVTIFGGLALGLAAIGIYGVLAYGVSQRTNEIGLRLAIGAGTSDVVSMIVRETTWMVTGGLAAGLVASYFLTRLVQSKLFGVNPTDPMVIVSALGILAAVGLLAAILPALRASRIDPAIALRAD